MGTIYLMLMAAFTILILIKTIRSIAYTPDNNKKINEPTPPSRDIWCVGPEDYRRRLCAHPQDRINTIPAPRDIQDKFLIYQEHWDALDSWEKQFRYETQTLESLELKVKELEKQVAHQVIKAERYGNNGSYQNR